MIQIISPSKLTTGGTELLHQLNYELEKLGADVGMAYYDKEHKSFVEMEINPNFKKYSTKKNESVKLNDSTDNVIVVAETMLKHISAIKNAKVYVWWLSVDNYKVNLNLDYLKDYGFKSFIYEIKKALTITPISKLKGYKHLVQSKYAKDFLSSYSVQSEYLSDYINTGFLDVGPEINKSDIICYNPAKGKNVTKRIIDFYKNKNSAIRFIPIVNMNQKQVAETLRSAKIYIDFGWHPGKDRIPREARLQNCIIITGKRGSARNEEDIRIPQKYKFDEKSPDFLKNIDLIITDVVNNFDENLNSQNYYKEIINKERSLFEKEVARFYEEVIKS
ncbi:hypothetical protein FY557_18790 [Chryseobacterium sp. SN22]|uniref:hypothetical protein n=1 Tax=Chryseobacterium sp. SN22 TaxID=2606431 RepID=UPI0011EC8D9C|nr:hypothetical protein [Chryseobacterium sp. SN22]KAA0126159.1 hypothetical protein FY557_18790 [Chryseobacterium sp. SN22]